ncbi:hypothetical protein IDH44_21715 [Paenibacillus sp. IB182496]|uniref:Uncharacterized protein n=1 Tax=Paenibacillus sabuli TaxID=2772509 RepID=A0A927BY07_9BACL|nr:hypothetical protein [Paenibacillus sabuli]MBD2847820.1 hypothetical protein [Paenibacillus sabuli]
MWMQLLLWSGLILPWFTLYFMRREAFKRYLPVALFTTVLTMNLYELGYVYEWWRIGRTIVPWGHITNVPIMFGVFFVSTLWIFHLTFRSAWLYFLVNAALDLSTVYLLDDLLAWIDIFTFVNLTRWETFLIMTGQAIVIYGFQRWYESEPQVRYA